MLYNYSYNRLGTITLYTIYKTTTLSPILLSVI